MLVLSKLGYPYIYINCGHYNTMSQSPLPLLVSSPTVTCPPPTSMAPLTCVARHSGQPGGVSLASTVLSSAVNVAA